MRKIVKAMRKVIYLRDQSNFKRYINSLLEEVDFTPIVNIVPKEIKSITFTGISETVPTERFISGL